MKQLASVLIVLGATVLLSGCALRIGKGDEPSRLEWAGLGTAYVAAPGIHGYGDEGIVRAGFLKLDRGGEILSLDIWPIFGLGVGLVGARVQVLPVEAGAGFIFYHPEALKYEPVTEPGKVEIRVEH